MIQKLQVEKRKWKLKSFQTQKTPILPRQIQTYLTLYSPKPHNILIKGLWRAKEAFKFQSELFYHRQKNSIRPQIIPWQKQRGGREYPASPWKILAAGKASRPGSPQHLPDNPGEAGRAVPVPTQSLQGFLQDVVAVAAQELLPRHVLTDAGGVSKGELVLIRGWAWGVLQAPGAALSHLSELWPKGEKIQVF